MKYLKVFVFVMVVVMCGVMVGQQGGEKKAANVAQTPVLGTADRIALQACEKQKSDARGAYQQAGQQEAAVAAEWRALHPGWRLNPVTFAVEEDVPATKTEVKKVEPKVVAPAEPVKK